MGKKLIKLPGKNEVDLIVEDYQTALNGVAAWVRVGLRIVDVKRRAGEGNFTKWLDENLVSHVIPMKRAHLFRAKAVAEHLLDKWKCLPEVESPLDIIEDLTHPLWNDVIGKSTRGLTLEVKEFKEISKSNEEAKVWCYDQWSNNAQLRDDYEPRVLAGELSYVGAKAAMIGIEHGTDQDGKRPATDHTELMRKNFTGATRHFKFYDDLESDEKATIHEAALNFAKSCPASLAELIRKNLPQSDE